VNGNANVEYAVVSTYVIPFAFVLSRPAVVVDSVMLPANRSVVDAYANEASVVDVLENVLSAVNVLAVYVFGIVVDAAMNELVVLFRNVESRVSAPPVFVRPEPSRELNVEPLITRFVVEAVVNDPYVVDENANVCSAVQLLALPRFRDRVPEAPPTTLPNVPEYDSDAPITGVDVATDCSAPVPAPYISCPPVNDCAPVPPPLTVSVPDTVGVNVRAPAVGTMFCPNVRPLNVVVVVENAIAVSDVVEKPEPRAVRVPPPEIIPSDEVDVSVYPPDELPTST
jgi:hypothetical protein